MKKDTTVENDTLEVSVAEPTTFTYKEETKPNIAGALFGGVLGAIVGVIIWYFVAVYSGYEIGYIALLLARLVSVGIKRGSGVKKGLVLQCINFGIVVIAIAYVECSLYARFGVLPMIDLYEQEGIEAVHQRFIDEGAMTDEERQIYGEIGVNTIVKSGKIYGLTNPMYDDDFWTRLSSNLITFVIFVIALGEAFTLLKPKPLSKEDKDDT